MTFREFMTRDISLRRRPRGDAQSPAAATVPTAPTRRAASLRPGLWASVRTGAVPLRFRLTRWTVVVFGLVVVVRYDPPVVPLTEALASTVRAAPLLALLLFADLVVHVAAIRRRHKLLESGVPSPDRVVRAPRRWRHRQLALRFGLGTFVAVLLTAAGQGLTGHPGGVLRWWAVQVADGSRPVVAVTVASFAVLVAVASAVASVRRSMLRISVPEGAGRPFVMPPSFGEVLEVPGFVGEEPARRALTAALRAVADLAESDDGAQLPGAVALVGAPGSGRSTLALAATGQAGLPSVVVHLSGRSSWARALGVWQARSAVRSLAARWDAASLIVVADGEVDRRIGDLVAWACEPRQERRPLWWGPRLRGAVFVVAHQPAEWMTWPVVSALVPCGAGGVDFARRVLASAGVAREDVALVLARATAHGPVTAAALQAAAHHAAHHAAYHASLDADGSTPVELDDDTLRRKAITRAGVLLAAGVGAVDGADRLVADDPVWFDSRRRADVVASSYLSGPLAEELLTGDVTRAGATAIDTARRVAAQRCATYGGDAHELLGVLTQEAARRLADLPPQALCAVAHAEALFGPLSVAEAVAIAGGARTATGDGRWYLDGGFAAAVEAWCRSGGPVPLPSGGAT